MKKSKVLLSIILVLSILAVSILPVLAESVTDLKERKPTMHENKIDDKLKNKMEVATNKELINVALWLQQPDEKDRDEVTERVNSSINYNSLIQKEKNRMLYSSHKAYDDEGLNRIAAEQAKHIVSNNVEKELINTNNDRIITNLKLRYELGEGVLFVSRYSPLVIVELSKSDIIRIAESDDISRLFLVDDIENRDTPNLYLNDNSEIYSDRSTDSSIYGYWQQETNIDTLRDDLGYTGYGIKIGMIDKDGIPDKTIPELSYAYNNIHNLDVTNTTGTHASYTAKIIVGKTNDYEGAAPDAQLYCNAGTCYPNQTPSNIATYIAMMKATEDIMDMDINILSASICLGYSLTYDYTAMFIDYLVNHYNVTVCIAAGNTGGAFDIMPSASTAYNSITVGNIDDKNTLDTTDDEIYHTLHLSGNTRQYKPDICAPGRNTHTAGSLGSGNGGTSAATPVVSGICALLMEARPQLINNPMFMKSVLLSSSKRICNMPNQTTDEDSLRPALSRFYGSGMVNALFAYQLLLSNNWANYTISELSNQSTHSIPIIYSSSDLYHSRRIFASICWIESVEKPGNILYESSSYTILNTKKYYIELLDPHNTVVSRSIYEYDRKQVLGYQPIEVGTYVLRITRFGNTNYYSNLSASYSIGN